MRKSKVELNHIGARAPQPLVDRIRQLAKHKTTRSAVIIRCLEMGLPALEKEQVQEKPEGIAA